MRSLGKWLCWCASLFAAARIMAAQSPAAARPNIIVILADDLGFSDVGCYGAEIRTPSIDGLAQAGLRFTQFYNASKCEPSRASLLSGLYWQQAQRGLKQGITIGQALHTAGYTTLACGKWHLDGSPVDRGFDHWFGFLHGATNYFKGDDSFRLDHAPFPIPTSGFYTTDAFTDYAIRFVGDARQHSPDKPFFLYLAYNAPHDPLQAPAEEIARYQNTYAAGWDALRTERYKRQIALGVISPQWQLSARADGVPAWDTLNAEARRLEALRMAVYAAMIDRLDQNIGRLLAKLKEWHLEENTVVIFLSDNGANAYDRNVDRRTPPGGADSTWAEGMGWANLSNTPFRLYKRYQHEGGIATPFIVRWSAGLKKPGSVTDRPADITDIMATCLDLSGCSYAKAFGSPSPPPLAGISLEPLFAGQPWRGHDALYFQLRDQRAVRVGNWKLASHDGGPWELYRMDLDRTEVDDLAPKQPTKVKELDALYERWWNRADISKNVTPGLSPVYINPSDALQKQPPEVRPASQPLDDD